MFFFIIGVGKRTVDRVVSAGQRVCPNCGNRAEWSTARVRSWVTLFFVPVFPYKSETASTCSICGYSVEAGAGQGQ
jgi:hypothetical protein